MRITPVPTGSHIQPTETERLAPSAAMQALQAQKEAALRQVAVPPITGAITPAKLKWRGIKERFEYFEGFGAISWFEQRGKRITSDFLFPLG